MKARDRQRILILLLASVLIISGCSQENEKTYKPTVSDSPERSGVPVYIFSIHPLHNPMRLHQVFWPMIDYLNRNIHNAQFKLEASRNYTAYEAKLYDGQAHFSLPNPLQAIKSLKHGYRIFGKMGDDNNFRGIILVRKDSAINKIEQLKGKAISYPAPYALAATLMPQYYLYTHGLDVMHDTETRYVGSQESSIMNVYLGNTAAGATWPPPWYALMEERPELKEALEVKWQTDSLPNNALVVRKDVPAELVHQVADLLFNLHTHEEGRQILNRMKLTRFEPATEQTYQKVVEFIAIFSKTVRPVE
ncbi:MAG: phosphate/phosphite/phosphonate ABC transporter substrate-binding protein [Nitrospirae bacterium]|nr:phosphate/phosphite/phosphonate ABC transporter substrate-binding protein [Nitrospirota bacterium]